jgi:peroxiredoxin family protein
MTKRATIICSTSELEKVYALFNIANGCASFGMEVTIFFTFNDVRELGVKFIACDMSMDMMDIREEDLIEGTTVGGIGTYVSEAKGSDISLFI